MDEEEVPSATRPISTQMRQHFLIYLQIIRKKLKNEDSIDESLVIDTAHEFHCFFKC